MKDHLGDDKVIKKQSITMTTIFGKAIEAVVAYIVLWFFAPAWKRLVKWWKGKDESNKIN
jgi:phage shock protein PspC (stress-responsive transcriptional regulator)|tara:strand:- start:67 stop:246 length:180 start_codon:yes stop_codon:yes gene_type:complete